MSHKRNIPQPDRPKLAMTPWSLVGLYRYDHKGKRQALRLEPYYHVPRKKRVRTAKQELVRQQKALAAAIGLTRDVKEYAEGRAAIESAKQGDLSPVRQRQLAEGFAKAGLAHLQ